MGTTKASIGRYLIREAIGRGAMGVVYRAEDPVIHRTVAVKVLPTLDGLPPEQVHLARERFTREGQALGRVDHPNIIRVFDVGEDPDSCEMYIVMEFVPGPNLERLLADAMLDRSQALSIVGQLAAGLDAAHACGIVHRDVKPSNILLTNDGTVKIADFGITFVPTSAMTQDMREIGTPAYMSPEQVSGNGVDSRADLFSLGVLTYELLTGRKPFEGTDVVSIAHAVVHTQPIPISVKNPELPKALNPVMDRILAKKPEGRFASGREFYEALMPCFGKTDSERPVAKVSSSWRQRRMAWGWASVAALAAFWVTLQSGMTPSAPAPAADSARVQPAPQPPKPAPVRPQAGAKSKPSVAAAKPAKQAAADSKPSRTAPPVATSPAIAKSEPKPSPPKPAAPKPAATSAKAPTAEVTIRFAHRLRRGTLTVMLDGVTVFSEPFSKKKMTIIQTTVWDPLKAPAGAHTLVARVKGEDGKTFVSTPYEIEFPKNQEVELRIGLKGDSLTVKPTAS